MGPDSYLGGSENARTWSGSRALASAVKGVQTTVRLRAQVPGERLKRVEVEQLGC